MQLETLTKVLIFLPTRLRPSERIKEISDQQPTHIAAHLQTRTSQRSSNGLQKSCNLPNAPMLIKLIIT